MRPLRPAFLRALALCALPVLLAACGGGGGGDDGMMNSTPPPVATGFNTELVSRYAATGVAGTWGYVAPDGGRYALMGTRVGVLVLDLRDPANPRRVDEIAGPDNTPSPGIYWREIRVRGHYAYVVSEQTNFRGGIMVIDLAGLPASVRFVRSVTPRDGQLAAHTLDIDTGRGLLYLQRLTSLSAPAAAGTSRPLHTEENPVGDANNGSVDIYELNTDPETPTYVTTFNQHKSVHDMTAAGDFVYVAEGFADSFSKWDVRNPAAPLLVARWPVGGFAHSLWPNADGSWLVTMEELPNGLPSRVFSMVGATATQVATMRQGTATPHNVVVEGNRAYMSHYTEGLVVWDLSNPAAPRLAAHFDTNSVSGPQLDGCWGVYKYPGEPLAICSDMRTGFNLIRITGQ
jgi:choice-of-anchor B domain-containing protein